MSFNSPSRPIGYHSVTPYLTVSDASQALAFYKAAFGAVELYRLAEPTEKVMHAEIKVGNSVLMLADEYPDLGVRGPIAYGGSPVSLLLYVEDADAQVERALSAGAKLVRPVKDQFYGDRSGAVADPFGYTWTIATQKPEPSEKDADASSAMPQDASD